MDSLRVYDGTLHWTPGEIQAMLSIWADSTIQKELESSKRNERVFLRISSELSSMGFLRSAKQCRDKLKKLKLEYRKLKNHISRGDVNHKRGKWFNLMDSVLGDTRPAPTTGGGVSANSAMAILEAMSSPSPASEDSAQTGDEPIVEVQILGDKQQSSIHTMHEESPSPPTPPVLMTNQALKRKRPLSSSDEWKKIIVESDQRYAGVLHRMLESESQHRREELQIMKEEMELKRADARLMRNEAASSSAVQGQLVSVLGQITELFRAKQAASSAQLPQGGNAQTSAWPSTPCREGRAGRELHPRVPSDAEAGVAPLRIIATESHEENHSRGTQNIIKTETEESVVVQQRTGTTPMNLDVVQVQHEDSQAHSTTQEATAINVQHGLLAAQQEQCRLMAESNSIQLRLVRAVSRSNRCMSELAKSIRAQSAAASSVQDRIVQLLERQEWTNQLLTMKVMGVSSTSSQNPLEARGGLPGAGPSSAHQSLFPGQEAAELSLTSTASDQCNA